MSGDRRWGGGVIECTEVDEAGHPVAEVLGGAVVQGLVAGEIGDCRVEVEALAVGCLHHVGKCQPV